MTKTRPTRHPLHAHQSHHGWNNEFPPLLTVAPGETVEFEIRDASGGQITERSGIEAVSGMDFGLVNPFTGPIGVAPAEPGLHSIVPPRRVGGNMDIRDVAAGTVLHLPIEVAGALF